jgi:hypothetical protein
MKMKPKNEEFYLEIEDSVELRRQMLETSKELIGILQQYEDMKNADTEKIDEIEHFCTTLKEISADISHLKSMMPKVRLSDLPLKDNLPKEPRRRPMPVEHPEPTEEAKPEPASPGKLLQSQLNEIEERLKDLQ